MFDVKKFIDRHGWTIKDLAARLFDKGGESRVGMWSSGESNPRYDAVCKLIMLGATAEELFGKEYAEILFRNSFGGALPPIPPGRDTPDWKSGMLKALSELQKEGCIKEIVINEKDGQ